MAALTLACTVLIGGGCSKDETGGSASFGDFSYSVTSAVAFYNLSKDTEGNPVTEYNIYLLFDGLTLEEIIDGTASMPSSCAIGMALPGETYELPVGTFMAEEDIIYAVFVSEKDQLESNISSCTMTIGRSGKNYTFRISGETEDGQPVSCRYTGPVQFVDFDSMM